MPSHSPPPAAGRNVPQQTAVSAIQSEDRQMQRFLNRMQRRDDGQQLIADSASGPTVPTALSRRLLHRQGAGYLDDTVAAIASASADRFLATVLHQAVACRDQRLKGAEMARGARRYRKRHAQQYQADTDDRRRRKMEGEMQREKANLAAISAGESMKKGGSAASKRDSEGTAKSKKKKKAAAPADTPANGNKAGANSINPTGRDDDDDESYDSVDDEEEFYRSYYDDNGDSDDSDEDDETLKLVDIARPLEAWDFHITGKLGLESTQADSDLEESDDDKDADDKSEDQRTDEGNAIKESQPDKDDNAKPAEDAAPPASPKRPTKAAQNPATPSQTQS